MPLFFVQDSDRPAHVFARDYGEAEQKWRKVVAIENECEPDEVDPPQGIAHVADDKELILEDNFVVPL